jgi:hypothetical protein
MGGSDIALRLAELALLLSRVVSGFSGDAVAFAAASGVLEAMRGLLNQSRALPDWTEVCTSLFAATVAASAFCTLASPQAAAQCNKALLSLAFSEVAQPESSQEVVKTRGLSDISVVSNLRIIRF